MLQLNVWILFLRTKIWKIFCKWELTFNTPTKLLDFFFYFSPNGIISVWVQHEKTQILKSATILNS